MFHPSLETRPKRPTSGLSALPWPWPLGPAVRWSSVLRGAGPWWAGPGPDRSGVLKPPTKSSKKVPKLKWFPKLIFKVLFVLCVFQNWTCTRISHCWDKKIQVHLWWAPGFQDCSPNKKFCGARSKLKVKPLQNLPFWLNNLDNSQ